MPAVRTDVKERQKEREKRSLGMAGWLALEQQGWIRRASACCKPSISTVPCGSQWPTLKTDGSDRLRFERSSPTIGPKRLVYHAMPLTPSLPWCHLKTTHKSEKFETICLFVFFFALGCERIFIKTHSIDIDVIGPENILFAGASAHLSARKFYMLGQWRG